MISTIKTKKAYFTSLLSIAFILFTFASCSKKVSFNNSSVVPAAIGNVKIKKDKNKNYAIQVKVNRLANPSRLSPSRNVYVVWMEGEQRGVKNIGQFKSSSSLLSKSLKGSLKTAVPFKPSKIYITAEDDGSVQYPGNQVVLSTDSF